MPVEERSVSAKSGRPKAGGRVVALRMGLGWLAVVVLGAAMGLGFVSSSTVAAGAGLVLGLLLAAVAASAAIIASGRVWPLFPVFLTACLYMVAAGMTAAGYVAGHGTRYSATAISSECHRVKGGTACTARLHRPDGTLLDDALPVEERMHPGQQVEVIEDPSGIVAPHTAESLDPVLLPVGAILLGAAAVLLAGLFGLTTWLGLRKPPQKRRGSGKQPRTR